MRLCKAKVDSLGFPILEYFESQQCMLDGASMSLVPPEGLVSSGEIVAEDFENEFKSHFKEVHVYLTNARLVFVPLAVEKVAAFHLPLGAIAQMERSKDWKPPFRSKLKIQIRLNQNRWATINALEAASLWKVRIVSSNHDSMDVLYRALSMAKNQWQHIPSELLRMFAQPLDNDSRVADEKVKRDACLSQLVEMGYSMDIATSAYDNCGSDKSVSSVVTWILERQENAGKTVNVGIDAVLQSEHNRVDAGAMRIEEGFADLENLSKMAQDLGQLAKQILDRKRMQGEDMEDTVNGILCKEMMEIGLIGNITKGSTGKWYLTQIADQVGQFLSKPIVSNHGALSLPQAYRIFNRARLDNPVSPEDFVKAVEMFDDLSIPMKLHCYQSGVKVLLLTGHQGDAIRSKVIDFIMQKSESNNTRYVGISRTNLATHLGMSVAVAGYYLEDAEAQGILCRDDSPIGLFFYKNLFPVL